MAGDAYGKRAKRPYSKLFQMFMWVFIYHAKSLKNY
jgi:hypothetical protein